MARRIVPLIVAVGLTAAGCGSSSSSDQRITQAADRVSVTLAELQLSAAVVSATKNGSGDVFGSTQKVARALQRARSDGVATAWIDKEIASAESEVEIVDCHDCFTVLEDLRSS